MTFARPGDDAPGPLLAQGRDAAVFDLGDGRVLRRYLDAARSSEDEARVMAHLADHGYPVPAVLDALGPDLVMRRVDGPTMLEDIGRRPWRLERHARTLADLHDRLHRVPVPAGLRAPFDGSEAVIHLDLHPANVLLARTGPVVIDWTNTAAGPAALDVAQTWLLLATSEIPAHGTTRRVLALGRRVFLARLLARLDRRAAARLLSLAAQLRRLDPNVTAAEHRQVDRLLARLGAAREGPGTVRPG